MHTYAATGTAFSPPVAGSTPKAASKAPQPVLGAAGLGASTGPPAAADLGALAKAPAPAVPKDGDGPGRGDSPLRARLAALEMELEALKRGSDGGALPMAGRRLTLPLPLRSRQRP